MLTFQRKTKTIEIEGQQVHLRALSEGEVQAWHSKFHDNKGRPIQSKMVDNRIHLAILSVVDDEGKLMFDESHVMELREWPAEVLTKIHRESSILSGIADEEDFEKKSSD